MLSLEVSIMSERGGRNYNEDACGHWQSKRQLCCVVADGAGGHGGGDVAARLAVKEVLRSFSISPSESTDQLTTLIRDANEAIRANRAPGPTLNMHTTVVCLVVDAQERQAHWAHAGDSRLYWFRDRVLEKRTLDHSLVQSLIDSGMWNADQLADHPKRSELVSALGVPGHELTVSSSLELANVQAGDVFLLCTDGCWEYLDDEAMERSLQAADSPDSWLSDLSSRIMAATIGQTSHDNFSALTVWVSAAPSSALGAE